MNVKEGLKSKGFTQWEVAEKMGISEFTLSRWLRRPEKLESYKIKMIEDAIEKLDKEAE